MRTNNSLKVIENELNPIIKQLSKHVDKRTTRNIKEATIGVINARSTRITEITYKSKRKCKRLIADAKRNYRMLKSKTWEKSDLESERFYSIKEEIKEDTPIGIDLSHIEHPDSKAIEGVCMVHAEDGKLVKGHWWLQSAARIAKRRILPLTNHIFSHETKDFISMPRTTFDFLDKLYSYIGNKGIWLFDRGFDSKSLVEKLLKFKGKFIIRLKNKRDVFVNGTKKTLQSILDEAEYPFKIQIRMKRKPRLIQLDFREIRIKGIEEKLWLVFTKSIFGETYILLTNIKVENFNDAVNIMRTYRYRWSVEDFFRAIKQELGIEKIMIRTLKRINKLIEIAMLAYFIAFRILLFGGQIIISIIEAGGKIGIKDKKEDTVGRILKGLACILKNNHKFDKVRKWKETPYTVVTI